jgi:uncharacterized DUF497 family protein
VYIEFDPTKDSANVAKHGVSLAVAAEIDWDEALVLGDLRHEYGELRFVALTPFDERLFVVVFSVRGEALRAISVRRANAREVRRYADDQD